MAFVSGGIARTVVSAETQVERVMVDAATQTWRLGEGGTNYERVMDPDAEAALSNWQRTKSVTCLIWKNGDLLPLGR